MAIAAPTEYWRGQGGFNWQKGELDRSYPGFDPLNLTTDAGLHRDGHRRPHRVLARPWRLQLAEGGSGPVVPWLRPPEPHHGLHQGRGGQERPTGLDGGCGPDGAVPGHGGEPAGQPGCPPRQPCGRQHCHQLGLRNRRLFYSVLPGDSVTRVPSGSLCSITEPFPSHLLLYRHSSQLR
eukprot:EG_transcript_17653